MFFVHRSQVKAGNGRRTQTLPVQKIVVHASYTEDKTDFDIAILILGKDAELNGDYDLTLFPML